MSRSPQTAEDTSEVKDYSRAFEDVFKLHEEGRSFSGNERNCSFLNTGDTRFASISAISGLDFSDDGRALATVDWDHDGDLDLWIANRTAPQVRFLRNNTPATRGFLALRLRSRTRNTDAIGARVEVLIESDDGHPVGKLVRSVRAGQGFLSQSSKWLHFGLGGDGRIRRAVVTWPDGSTEALPELERNQRYTVIQAEGATPWTATRPDLALRSERLDPSTPSTPRRALLTGRPPLPRIEYESFEGERVDLERAIDSPTLVNLWASWCLPCAHELSELSREAPRLADAGLRVVALSVDGLDDQKATGPEQARAFRRRLDFPFAAGMADEVLLAKLQLLHDRLFTLRLPFAVPTSFLIDSESRLAAIYRGPVEIERLLEDARNLDAPPTVRRGLATPFPGRWIADPEGLRLTSIAQRFLDEGYPEDAVHYMQRSLRSGPGDAQLYSALGRLLMQQNRYQDAIETLELAIELDPTDLESHFALGTTLQRMDRLDDAVAAFERVLSQAPSAAAHNNLGVVLMQLERSKDAEE
ncbi:MAG: tetratricopeptide repeat protein, partial [Acidobacteriota bacterium]|nr:tetratricopeptide repeat protein [Acidobacteriota bacterium]